TKFILQEGIGANEGAVGKRVETGIVGTEGVTGGQEIFSRAGRRSRELYRLSMIISKIVRFVSIMVASINMVSSGSQDLNLNQEYWLAPCQGWKG
ncbi:18214_t:CDS:2, partial [Rhizophagus irregularis]